MKAKVQCLGQLAIICKFLFSGDVKTSSIYHAVLNLNRPGLSWPVDLILLVLEPQI